MAEQTAGTEKKLSRKTLIKTWLSWIAFAQMNYNFERLQGLGYCHAMTYPIKALFDKADDVKDALTRHLNFFNTESTWGSIIVGITCALEEEKANNPEMDASIINNVKTSLMGPMAGIGDSITQGLVKVVLLAIGIDLAIQGNALGPVLYVLLFTLYTVGLSYILFFQGYRMGKTAVISLLSSNIIDKAADALKIMSLMIVGGLSASMIRVKSALVFTLGETVVEIQPILDNIFPKLLSLGALFLSFYLLKKREKSPTYVLGVLFAIGFIGTFLKLLG